MHPGDWTLSARTASPHPGQGDCRKVLPLFLPPGGLLGFAASCAILASAQPHDMLAKHLGWCSHCSCLHAVAECAATQYFDAVLV